MIWNLLGFDVIKEKNKELEDKIENLNIDIEETNREKRELEKELEKYITENIKLKEELKVNNEIIENLYTEDDKDLIKQYKLKLIDLNKYKEKTNTKILTLEEYNKVLKNELCNLRIKYEKMNKISNYRKERNEKLENKYKNEKK